jgi:hypothetical protein
MLSFAVSKLMRSDSILLSGLVTPPSHSPVSGSRVGTGSGVEEGIGDAVGRTAAAGAAQAVRNSIRERDKDRRRMHGSIVQAVLILTTLQRGIRRAENVFETESVRRSGEANRTLVRRSPKRPYNST